MANIPGEARALHIALGRAILEAQALGERLEVSDDTILVQAATMWISRHRALLRSVARAASLGIAAGTSAKAVFSRALQQPEIEAQLGAQPSLRDVIDQAIRDGADRRKFLAFLYALRDLDR